MKKIKSILFIISFLIVTSSCDPFEVFERTPLDKISDAQVWQQEGLLNAYIYDLYARFPFYPFPVWNQNVYTDLATLRQSSTNQNTATTGGMSRSAEVLGYWNYSYIRDLNFFIEKIADAPLNEDVKNHMEGQVRAIRAIVYFEKQKRYGGVPLVDVVLDPFVTTDEKYLKRSTEEQIADFIDNELTKAIELLKTDHTKKGLINRWTAYGYKARANLWAASIAKYGTVQIDGLIGIPLNRANEFYQKAADAANTIIQSGRYELYNAIPDKAENYRSLFLTDSNSEIIFERLYDGVTIYHSASFDNAPERFSSGQGATNNPFLEFLYGFENIDGSTDQPEIGVDHLYVDGIDLWKNKDPRLRATVFLQGETYAGYTIEAYEGLDPSLQPDPGSIISDHKVWYQGTRATGLDSRFGSSTGFRTSSGFLLRKYLEDEPLIDRTAGKVSWKVMRLAEMYLTLAEAEFELGNLNEAAEALNATRERAGISLVNEGNITLAHIRTERKNELAFEGFRWWDLRRWRTAEDILHRDAPFQGLRTILHFESGKFYFLPMNAEVFTRVFRPEHVYNPILVSRIQNNPLLIENPGYN